MTGDPKGLSDEVRRFLERWQALQEEAPPGWIMILQAPPRSPPALPPASSRGHPLDTEAHALALLIAHPDWSAARIARELGVSRTTLYRSQNFRAAMRARTANGMEARRKYKGYRDEVQ